jgi:hypothetical protein
MIVSFMRYSRDQSFKVLSRHPSFVLAMARWFDLGDLGGAVCCSESAPPTLLLPLLAVILFLSAIKLWRHR